MVGSVHSYDADIDRGLLAIVLVHDVSITILNHTGINAKR
jgi:hypothetical protein